MVGSSSEVVRKFCADYYPTRSIWFKGFSVRYLNKSNPREAFLFVQVAFLTVLEKKGSTICPASEIVCFPVLISTYSHVETSIFFSLDLFFFVTQNPFQIYHLVSYIIAFFGSIAETPSYFLSLILLCNIRIKIMSKRTSLTAQYCHSDVSSD